MQFYCSNLKFDHIICSFHLKDKFVDYHNISPSLPAEFTDQLPIHLKKTADEL